MEGKRGRKVDMTSSCQTSDLACPDISVSHSICAVSWISGSPCMPWLEQPSSGGQGTVLYYRLLMSCWLHRLLGSDLSLPLTWQEPGSQHQHLQREVMGDPANLAQGWTGCAGWTTGQDTLNQSLAPKSLQLRLPHFITDTHTYSFPFTWVLLMDLGLGSADNINGSRLTEVPLQWTVCLCVYMHTQLFFFFLNPVPGKVTKSVKQADAIQVPSVSYFL